MPLWRSDRALPAVARARHVLAQRNRARIIFIAETYAWILAQRAKLSAVDQRLHHPAQLPTVPPDKADVETNNLRMQGYASGSVCISLCSINPEHGPTTVLNQKKQQQLRIILPLSSLEPSTYS